MPSIINTHHTPSAPPSSLEFVSDDAAYYRNTHPSSPSKPSATLQDLKESNRRQWYDPDDEFSVPIHTKHPLITKKPLDMSSFLLNYRTMHRSIEIMTPPPSSQISDEPSSKPSSLLHPTIPDGPIYIHHRSTLAGSAISDAVSCPHVNCLEHSRQSYSCARSGPSTCLKKQLFPSRLVDQDSQETLSRPTTFPYNNSGHEGLSSTSRLSSSVNPSSQEHTFLESHIASIGQWLSLNAGTA